MNYEYEKIGERIKTERKKLKMTQEAFAEKYHVKRATVSRWEHGETMPNFQTMLDICADFNCELGYLLCENGYENKTRETTDICKATGLSEEAVEILIKRQESKHKALSEKKEDNEIDRVYRFFSRYELFLNIFLENGFRLFGAVADMKECSENIREMRESPYFFMIADAMKENDYVIESAVQLMYEDVFSDDDIQKNEIWEILKGKYAKSDDEIEKIYRETDGFFLHCFVYEKIKNYQQYEVEQLFLEILKEYLEK